MSELHHLLPHRQVLLERKTDLIETVRWSGELFHLAQPLLGLGDPYMHFGGVEEGLNYSISKVFSSIEMAQIEGLVE
jgi:hypothetical protein